MRACLHTYSSTSQGPPRPTEAPSDTQQRGFLRIVPSIFEEAELTHVLLLARGGGGVGRRRAKWELKCSSLELCPVLALMFSSIHHSQQLPLRPLVADTEVWRFSISRQVSVARPWPALSSRPPAQVGACSVQFPCQVCLGPDSQVGWGLGWRRW